MTKQLIIDIILCCQLENIDPGPNECNSLQLQSSKKGCQRRQPFFVPDHVIKKCQSAWAASVLLPRASEW